ncbi:hypothetical protein M569_16778 [Genlisea aurea]|uniref:Uncharacterized protein n=1 Tax=Genlisea aurea TaxID=192259 RepID=S8BUI9_9LAMI|nr:hypothetical protein M569_16778 [Genlisea aurea]
MIKSCLDLVAFRIGSLHKRLILTMSSLMVLENQVQRLIAAAPNFLVEGAAAVIFSRPAKTFSGKKKRTTGGPERRDHHPQQQQQQQQRSISENVPEDPSGSAARDDGSCGGASSFCFGRHLLRGGRQLLIPVISPSEGLVYKPYPVPTTCEGGCCGPDPGNNFFPSPVYGVPAASSARIPSDDDVVVQGSSSSASCSPVERDVLQLFPAAGKGGTGRRNGDWPIRAVPRNGVSASESAARIFRCIQEERKRHDSV